MPLVLQILSVTFPFFAPGFVRICGRALGHAVPAAIPGLNSFVLFFAVCRMLYRFGANTPIAQLPIPAWR